MSQCVTTLLFQVFEHIRHDVPWPHECQLSTTPHRHHARHNVRRWLRRSWWRHCIPTVTNIERQTDNTSPQMSWFIHYTSPQLLWLINSASLQMMTLITQIHWYDSYTTQIHRLWHDSHRTNPWHSSHTTGNIMSPLIHRWHNSYHTTPQIVWPFPFFSLHIWNTLKYCYFVIYPTTPVTVQQCNYWKMFWFLCQ